MQQIPFIDLFKSALHVSGDKLAHPQDKILTVYTVFGTMTLSPVGSNIGALYQNCTHSQKVLLMMGEFVAHLQEHFWQNDLVTGQQQYRCIVPKLYAQSKSAPDDGRVCRPKYVEHI
jgi:hypothetical protein